MLRLAVAALVLMVVGVGPFDAPAARPADGSDFAALDPADAIVRLLRAAGTAADAGRIPEAAELYLLAAERGVVADYADLLRARMRFEHGDMARAAVAALKALQTHPDSPLRADLYQLLGLAREGFDDDEAARAAYRAALALASDSDRKAALRLAIARSHERSGEPREAATVYRELWIQQPATDEAEIAGERLADLASQPGIAEPSAEDWRRRGDQLFRARHNERALAAYDRALALGPDTSNERRASTQRAQTLFRLRRYSAAQAAFGALPQTGDIPIWHARSRARAGDVMGAVAEFDAFAQKRRDEFGVRALYLAALLLDGRAKDEAARLRFDQVASSRHSELASAAVWRLAWSDYRVGRYEECERRLARISEREGDGLSGLRFRYWRARALEELGRSGTRELYAEIGTQFPFSYYGLRARERARGVASPELEVEAIPKGRRRLGDVALARPRILIAAGLEDEARNELGAVRRNVRSLSDRLALAQLYAEAGDYHRPQRLLVDAYAEELAQGPRAGQEELWWYAWPLAFAPQVDAATRLPGRAPRELVYAIMREESGYRPAVLSVSGARGLLQIMIPTGERLARIVGRDSFDPDDLFDAQTNIELGAAYLGELSARFPEAPAAAIASYNAGPVAVAEWLADRGSADDVWVEAIPYEQTRHYVKRVLRSLHVYRVLY